MKAAVKSFAASSSSSSLASVRAHMWFLHGSLTTFSAALLLLLLSLALTTTTSTCQAAFTRTMILFVHPTTLRPCARRSSKTSSYGSSFTTTAVATIAHMSSSTAGDDNDEDHHQQQQQASSSSPDQDQDQDRLVLSKEAIQQQMAQLRSKYPTTEADYLAAARARNAARVASTERQATDDDWQSMATEKEQKYGKQDDWEASQKDAGNKADSQILLPLEMTKEGSLDEDDEEPKLMLF